MKVVENSPQNPRNCTIFKKILGGACPQTPLAEARSFAARDMPLRGMYIQNPGNFKVGPPLEKSCIRPWDYIIPQDLRRWRHGRSVATCQRWNVESTAYKVTIGHNRVPKIFLQTTRVTTS